MCITFINAILTQWSSSLGKTKSMNIIIIDNNITHLLNLRFNYANEALFCCNNRSSIDLLS